MNKIVFIHKYAVLRNSFKDVTYGKTFCDNKEKEEEPNYTRLAVGGDRINYPGDCGTPTADLLTVKILFKSVISTTKANFMTLHIKFFYLNTPVAIYKYICLKIADLPEYMIE